MELVYGLTAVDSRDASVISRLPFSPSRAGTRINNSPTLVYTSQCCRETRKNSNRDLTALTTQPSTSCTATQQPFSLSLGASLFCLSVLENVLGTA